MVGRAFGRQTARLDHSVLYARVPRLFEDLALARLDGRFPRLIDKLTRVQTIQSPPVESMGPYSRKLFAERGPSRSLLVQSKTRANRVSDWLAKFSNNFTEPLQPQVAENGKFTTAARHATEVNANGKKSAHPG